MSLSSTLVPIIRGVFSRWTALQIAVSHSMGGPETDAKYEAFIDAYAEYIARNVRPNMSVSSLEQDIEEYLDEVLDEEFNTVLDDGSNIEIAKLTIRYIQMVHEGKLAEVQQELQSQQGTARSLQMSIQNKNENDDSSSDSDDDEDMNNDQIPEEKSHSEPNTQSMDVDEDGWTTVHRRGTGRK